MELDTVLSPSEVRSDLLNSVHSLQYVELAFNSFIDMAGF